MPAFIRCAILWASIAAVICIGYGFFAVNYGLIFSDLNADGHLTYDALHLKKEFNYIVPLAALFGAAFWALFSTQRFNVTVNKPASAIKRGLVGAGLGLLITLLIALYLAINVLKFNFNDHYQTGMFTFAMLFVSALIPIFAILALLTPAHCLAKNQTP